VVSSISQASRCSRVASGNKRTKTSGVCLVMKAGSSSRQPGLRAMSRDTYRRTTPPHQIFQSGISPKVGKNHIMADFRQIMWRKFLRNLCKYSTMAQKVLPHNLAWPFLPFLPSYCRPLSTATLCGRKRLMTPKVAPMLRQMVLPDNVAPPIFSQIFVGADTKIYDQHIFGWSRHIMCQKWQARAGKTRTFAGILSQVLLPTPHP
jgi:hypothetical protein